MTTDATAGDVAACLQGMRNRAEGAAMPFSPPLCIELSQADVPALLGVVEAVVALADEWRQKGLALGARIVTEDMDGARAGFAMCTAQAYENCASATRMAIAAALPGRKATDV